MARRVFCVLLTLLALFLVGTVVVLTSISTYLAIALPAYITEAEVPPSAGRDNSTEARSKEVIPRILHQTWKTEVLPERWQPVAKTCKDLMPDYEYMMWTDVKSREFIAEKYSWFLPTFDGYIYPIQRADAIRYFILHYYGGVYLDLDVGCLRPVDPLLTFDIILPKTNPVGISNDLMFVAKGHPFIEQTIHNIIAFDHSWIINYPTVMFSTGPMFLSAQYSIYNRAHPPTPSHPGGEVRILPQALYGKNAKPGMAPHSFFAHYYGSSWHSDDAGFVAFLGKWGKTLMWVGLVVLVGGVARSMLAKKKPRRRRSHGRSNLLLPRGYQDRQGNHRVDFGLFTIPVNFLRSSAASPPTSPPGSPRLPLLPMSLDDAPPSPTSSTSSQSDPSTIRRLGAWMSGSRSQSRGGTLFFLPGVLTSAPAADTSSRHESDIPLVRPRSRIGHSAKDSQLESTLLLAESSSEYPYPRSRGSNAGLETPTGSPPAYPLR